MDMEAEELTMLVFANMGCIEQTQIIVKSTRSIMEYREGVEAKLLKHSKLRKEK